MGLIGKFFGSDSKPAVVSSKFADSQLVGVNTKPRSSARRDLVKLALRDTMRKHGVPSDWIDCRSLSVLTREQQSGMHVQFLVRKADQQVLPFVHALQESFWREIESIDPQARQWLFSVGWEFYGKAEPQQVAAPQTPTAAPAPVEPEDDLASDLQALQALMTAPAVLESESQQPAAAKRPA
ncbi:hypothetical protein GCM10027034_01890 [Ramlibacter solisilvae]|uniref:Uncharacterized protein n=1 Tax=Ramlibacter tataouinensis TaxID=94132 RepID=A0A127JP88_9BURK|nr:hypothetical protein [Ramlibacter tataouinensis]AMO21703.1 hypothetical protein UC35_00970 [Ramlibacter tataouinensis]